MAGYGPQQRCRPAAAAAAFSGVLRSLPVVRHSRKVSPIPNRAYCFHVDVPAGRAGSSPSSANTAANMAASSAVAVLYPEGRSRK